MCTDEDVLDLSHAPAVWHSCEVVGMVLTGVCELGGKRGVQNNWLKSNLVSVRGFDITISFEKYSLELFVKVRGRGIPAFSKMKNSLKTPVIIQHLETI